MTTHVYEFSCDCCHSVEVVRKPRPGGGVFHELTYRGEGMVLEASSWAEIGKHFGLGKQAVGWRGRNGLCLRKSYRPQFTRRDADVNALARKFATLRWA